MPYRIVAHSARCKGGWAVENAETGRIMGCHKTRSAALAQLAALHIHVDDAVDKDTNDRRTGDVSYRAAHYRVESKRGKPARCDRCGKKGGSAKDYHWAHTGGSREDTSNYRRLCVDCHNKLDGPKHALSKAIADDPAEEDWKLIHEVADAEAGGMANAFVASWTRARRRITDEMVAQAMRSPSGMADLFAVLEEVPVLKQTALPPYDWSADPAVNAYARISSRTATGTLERVPGMAPETRATLSARLDVSSPFMRRAAQTMTAEQVTRVNEQTKRTIRQITYQAQRDGTPPDEVARRIRRVVGLTPGQARAVGNYRDGLGKVMAGEMDPDSIGPRRYKNGKWQGRWTLADKPPPGLTSRKADQLADRYSNRLLDHRARTIARTESIRAANYGQQLTWQEMGYRRALPSTFARQWLTHEDERTCPWCLAMDGQIVALTGQFRGVVGRNTVHTLTPPLHPNCRCSLVAVRLPDARRRSQTADVPVGWRAAQAVAIGAGAFGTGYLARVTYMLQVVPRLGVSAEIRAIEALLKETFPTSRLGQRERSFLLDGINRTDAEEYAYAIGRIAERYPQVFDEIDTFKVARIPSGASAHSISGHAKLRSAMTINADAVRDHEEFLRARDNNIETRWIVEVPGATPMQQIVAHELYHHIQGYLARRLGKDIVEAEIRRLLLESLHRIGLVTFDLKDAGVRAWIAEQVSGYAATDAEELAAELFSWSFSSAARPVARQFRQELETMLEQVTAMPARRWARLGIAARPRPRPRAIRLGGPYPEGRISPTAPYRTLKLPSGKSKKVHRGERGVGEGPFLHPDLIPDENVAKTIAKQARLPGFEDFAGRTDRVAFEEIMERQARIMFDAGRRSMEISREATELHALWYPIIRKWTDDLAVELTGTPVTVSGRGIRAATAALSPGALWENNVAWADFLTRAIANDIKVERAWFVAAKTEFPESLVGKRLSQLTDEEVALALRGSYDFDPVVQLDDPRWGDPLKKAMPNTLDNIEKAVSVLRNDSVANIDEKMGFGAKVRSFYNNMENPLDDVDESVTADTHHFGVANQQPFTTSSPEIASTPFNITDAPNSSVVGVGGTYPLVAEATRRATRQFNELYGTSILPNQFQSIIWELWRAEYPDWFRRTPAVKRLTNDVNEVLTQRARGLLTWEEAEDRIVMLRHKHGAPTRQEIFEWFKDDLAGRRRRKIGEVRNVIDQLRGGAIEFRLPRLSFLPTHSRLRDWLLPLPSRRPMGFYGPIPKIPERPPGSRPLPPLFTPQPTVQDVEHWLREHYGVVRRLDGTVVDRKIDLEGLDLVHANDIAQGFQEMAEQFPGTAAQLEYLSTHMIPNGGEIAAFTTPQAILKREEGFYISVVGSPAPAYTPGRGIFFNASYMNSDAFRRAVLDNPAFSNMTDARDVLIHEFGHAVQHHMFALWDLDVAGHYPAWGTEFMRNSGIPMGSTAQSWLLRNVGHYALTAEQELFAELFFNAFGGADTAINRQIRQAFLKGLEAPELAQILGAADTWAVTKPVFENMKEATRAALLAADPDADVSWIEGGAIRHNLPVAPLPDPPERTRQAVRKWLTQYFPEVDFKLGQVSVATAERIGQTLHVMQSRYPEVRKQLRRIHVIDMEAIGEGSTLGITTADFRYLDPNAPALPEGRVPWTIYLNKDVHQDAAIGDLVMAQYFEEGLFTGKTLDHVLYHEYGHAWFNHVVAESGLSISDINAWLFQWKLNYVNNNRSILVGIAEDLGARPEMTNNDVWLWNFARLIGMSKYSVESDLEFMAEAVAEVNAPAHTSSYRLMGVIPRTEPFPREMAKRFVNDFEMFWLQNRR